MDNENAFMYALILFTQKMLTYAYKKTTTQVFLNLQKVAEVNIQLKDFLLNSTEVVYKGETSTVK